MSLSRRSFLGSTAVLVGGTMAAGKVWGANERIPMGVVGFNGQGRGHIKTILENPGAELVALCDVDSNVLAREVKNATDKTGKAPKAYKDVREFMADKSIAALSTATPNHWHALVTIWGLEAGKHVYVEKPMAHNAWEAKQCLAASKKYGKVIQHGTQSRCDVTLMRDMKLIKEGFIGKIFHSRGYVYKNGNREAIGHGAPGPVPANLDWTLWQGPSKDKPFLVNTDRKDKPGLHVHYDWHWFWEYGNGEIGNQGVHEMDIACWGHGGKTPVKISSTGGRYKWQDDGQTPNTQATQYTYADGTMMTFEVRNIGSFVEGGEKAGDCGDSFFGENGYYVRGVGFFGYDKKPLEVKEPLPEKVDRFERFFRAVRSGKQEDAPMLVEDAAVCCLHIGLGNAAYRVGRTLEYDAKTEKFTNCDEANAMLTREYREGFEVKAIS